MRAQSLKNIDRQIQSLKNQLTALGPIRPGTLSRQYRKPRERAGAFWQISYTHQMKSRSEYVRPRELPEVRQEIAAFRRFKKLTARWVELALRRSQIRVQQTRVTANLEPRPAKKRPKATPLPGKDSNIHGTP
jgi:hypothetical protein